MLCAGNCLEKLKFFDSGVVNYYLQAFEIFPERAESVFNLSHFFLKTDEHQKAYDLAQLAIDDVPIVSEFCDPDIYKYKLKLCLIQCCYALGNDSECIDLSNDLLTDLSLNESVRIEVNAIRANSYQRSNPLSQNKALQQNRFLIVVAFHNAGNYLAACIESIKQQSYENYRVVLIDDASDDECLDSTTLTDRFRMIRHKQRTGAMLSAHQAILRYSKPDDIVLHLDGDDSLAHDQVLEYLNQVYERSNCWVLYGQYRTDTGHIGHARPFYSDELDYPPLTHRAMSFPVHIRSYRAGLYHQIKHQDENYSVYKDSTGQWLTSAVDIAQMRVIFQLAGHEHIRFNNEVIYLYNYNNPLGTHYVATDQQKLSSKEIAGHKVLKPVRHYLPSLSSRPACKYEETKHKVLCLGFDGGNSEIIHSLLKRKLLPSIEKLFADGSIIEIDNIHDSCGDGVFWPCIYTASKDIEHGRLFRVQPDLFESKSTAFDTTKNFFAPPFWNDLLEHQLKVTLIDLPHGSNIQDDQLTIVNNWLVHERESGFFCHPKSLLSESNVINKNEDIFITAGKASRPQEYSEHFKLFSSRIKRKNQLNLELIKKDWDFFMTVFGEPHDISHYWWHQHDPSHRLHDEKLTQEYGDIIEHTYLCLDQSIGELAKHIDADTHVFLICGLSMGKNISCNSVIHEIIKRLVLHWEASGGYSNLVNSLKSSHVTISPLPYNNNASPIKIYANSNYESVRDLLLDALESSLGNIVNIETNNPVVASIHRMDELNDEQNYPFWPDVFVNWQREEFIDCIYSDEIGEIKLPKQQSLDCRSGDHLPQATLFMNTAAKNFHKKSDIKAEDIGRLLGASAGVSY